MISAFSRITCRNIGCQDNGHRPCQGAWHAFCFKQHPNDPFPVYGMEDIEGSLFAEDYDDAPRVNRFHQARYGNHLVTPFQCGPCHVVNILGRLPSSRIIADTFLLVCIHRATLDSLWSRASSTISGNLLAMKKLVKNVAILGAGEACLCPRGPHPKSDSWGMLLGCTMLVRSLDEGKNAPKVQFHTICRARVAYTIYIHTCNDGMGDSFIHCSDWSVVWEDFTIHGSALMVCPLFGGLSQTHRQRDLS